MSRERASIDAATRWAAAPLAAAARFSLGGPRFLPRVLRRLPLLVLVACLRLQLALMASLSGHG